MKIKLKLKTVDLILAIVLAAVGGNVETKLHRAAGLFASATSSLKSPQDLSRLITVKRSDMKKFALFLIYVLFAATDAFPQNVVWDKLQTDDGEFSMSNIIFVTY